MNWIKHRLILEIVIIMGLYYLFLLSLYLGEIITYKPIHKPGWEVILPIP